jgi:UTP--glucose-1-phosphate uridylyltransferase
MTRTIQTAIFPVAGLGTRLLPATKSVPKELMPVYDRPVLQHAIDEAIAAGITRLVFVTHPSKDAIRDYLTRDRVLDAQLRNKGKDALARELDDLLPSNPVETVFVDQMEPLGLGHAILCARDVTGDGPVAVLLPDDAILAPRPTIADMAAAYGSAEVDHMIAAMWVPRDAVSRYGIVDADMPEPGQVVPVRGMVEKPAQNRAPSQLAVVGRYVLSPGIWDALADTPPGAGNEIQLTDAIARSIGTGGVSAFRIAGDRFDCGSHDGLVDAGVAFRDAARVTAAVA